MSPSMELRLMLRLVRLNKDFFSGFGYLNIQSVFIIQSGWSEKQLKLELGPCNRLVLRKRNWSHFPVKFQFF